MKKGSHIIAAGLAVFMLFSGCASNSYISQNATSELENLTDTESELQTGTETTPENQEGVSSTEQGTEVAEIEEIETEGDTQQEDMHSPVEFTIPDPENTRKLSTKRCSFSFGVAKNGEPNTITVNNQKNFDKLNCSALAWDNKTEEKVLYLTFDCGYEYENLTADILNILKEKEVSAAFFCTQHYLESSSENVARMIDEGHIVGNHSTHHPEDCSALSREELADEILGVHNYLRENYGYICQYFRFPSGVYSENALDLVKSVGYHSVFWSLAYADWDTENQPSKSSAYNTLTSRLHPGAVILLHATSPVNAEVLGEFVDYAKSQGYEFYSLDQYSSW